MIIDDEPDNLNVLESALSQAGYRVSAFPSGELALASAQAEPPDLVLLDIRMPGMDGHEVCRRFKADGKLHPIPVIFISALAATNDVTAGFACGGVDYIAKPFREPEVLARVRTHLALRSAYLKLAGQHAQMKRTQEELLQANECMRQLAASREEELRAATDVALRVTEDEGRRIGQEIHDGLCQELVGLLRMAESLGASHVGNADIRKQVPLLTGQAAYALRLAREVSYSLTLHDLEMQTLSDALTVFVRRFENVSGVAIELNCASALSAFSKEQSAHVYRIVREAVVNAIRHGSARHIWIDLIQERQRAIVSVTNDGEPVQADLSTLTPGIGLRQVWMRAQLLGGTFALRRDAQGQTVAELIIPFGEQKEGHL
jgi:signal transduction histidine kinase